VLGRGEGSCFRLPFGFVGRKQLIGWPAKDGICQTWNRKAADPGAVPFLLGLEDDFLASRIAGFSHRSLRLYFSVRLDGFQEPIRGEPTAELFGDRTAVGFFLSHHDDQIVAT